MDPVPSPNQGSSRDERVHRLRSLLVPRFPKLSERIQDWGFLDIFALNPELHGRSNSVWLTDGEVTDPIEMKGITALPKATFALQAEIIPIRPPNQPNRIYCGWNLLGLNVVGNYNPEEVAKTIEKFCRTNDAYEFVHFLCRKIGHTPDFDIRLQPAASLAQYLGVFEHIKGKAFAISTKRQLGELEIFQGKTRVN